MSADIRENSKYRSLHQHFSNGSINFKMRLGKYRLMDPSDFKDKTVFLSSTVCLSRQDEKQEKTNKQSSINGKLLAINQEKNRLKEKIETITLDLKEKASIL